TNERRLPISRRSVKKVPSLVRTLKTIVHFLAAEESIDIILYSFDRPSEVEHHVGSSRLDSQDLSFVMSVVLVHVGGKCHQVVSSLLSRRVVDPHPFLQIRAESLCWRTLLRVPLI